MSKILVIPFVRCKRGAEGEFTEIAECIFGCLMS